MGVIRGSAVAVLVLLLSGLLLPGVAVGHGVSDTADVSLAQSLGGNELTVIIRRVPQVPGPLQVDVLAHWPVQPLDLRVSLGDEQRSLDVRAAGTHSVTLHVDAPGLHELALQADEEQALLPFRVLTPRTARWELVTYGDFTVAGLALAGALVTAARARPGNTAAGVRPGHTAARRGSAVALAGLSALALTAAFTAAGLSSTIPPPLPDGAAPVPVNDPAGGAAGRPYALGAVSTAPVAPVAGDELTLRLGLVDGSTGQPVDDLVAHHDALAHTVVTSADAGFFAHLHPVRTGPGELAVRLVPDRPGRYLVHTELERADSGAQLVSGEFTVGGDVMAGDGEPGGDGSSSGAVPAHTTPEIRSVPARAVAGQSSTLEVDTGADDLQPWLGMAGHLIIRDDSGRFFAHVHEMGSMTPPGMATPDETVAHYGPLLRFTFTFPAAGQYRAWVQYAKDFEIHTTPLTIDVVESERRSNADGQHRADHHR